MKQQIGCFVVYCPCGGKLTGAQVDFGPEHDNEDYHDNGMLLDALRNGNRMEYRPGSPIRVSIGGPCACPPSGRDGA